MSRQPPSSSSRPVSLHRVSEALSLSCSSSLSNSSVRSHILRTDSGDPDSERISASISASHSSLSGGNITDSQKLFEALCKAQAQVSAYETEIAELKAKLADLTMAVNVGTVDRARECVQDVMGHSFNKEFNDDVAKWGRHFGLFYSFIVVPADFHEKPKVLFNSLHPDRFRPENREFGIALELFECLPQKYHDLVNLAGQSEKSYFSSTFIDALQSSRSTTLTSMRQKIVPAVFGDKIPNSSFVFATSYDRTTVPQIKEMLGETHPDKDANVQYPCLPPLLYRDLNVSRVSGCFRNEQLFSIARGVVFGVTAVNAPTKAVARSKCVYLRSDKRPEATFGFIAAISILTRMVFSVDTVLDKSGFGNVTKTNYLGDFNFYKYTLASQAASSDPPTQKYVMDLLEEWNTKVFGAQLARYNANAPDSDSTNRTADVHTRDTWDIEYDRDQLRREAALDQNTSPTKPTASESVNNETHSDSDGEPESHSLELPDNYPHGEVEDGQYMNAGHNQDARDYWDQIQAEGEQLNRAREIERADDRMADFPAHASFSTRSRVSQDIRIPDVTTVDITDPTTIPDTIITVNDSDTGAQAVPSRNATRRATRENSGNQKAKSVHRGNTNNAADSQSADAQPQRPLRATVARTRKGKGANV